MTLLHSQERLNHAWLLAADAALDAAEAYCGATAPNPPVGAAALDAAGKLLGAAAHERAGLAHAEASLLTKLEHEGRASEIHTVLVSLEPCNHTGRTPPCAEALLRARVKRVIYLVDDPNPKASGGALRLRGAGIEVLGPSEIRSLLTADQNRKLLLQLGPFLKRIKRGLPWITLKQALNHEGSMIPPQGQKTFTSEESLFRAHELRRRADAILSGSGTILADDPQFTVRRLRDHPGKMRRLWITDRRARVPDVYFKAANKRGFLAKRIQDWRAEMIDPQNSEVLEVLVEAGPLLSAEVLQSQLWDRHVTIQTQGGAPDRITEVLRAGVSLTQI